MISPDDISLPEIDSDCDYRTSCGYTSNKLNQDIDWKNCIGIYSYDGIKRLEMKTLICIQELLNKHNKIVVTVDVSDWFDHEFTLFNTTEGIYIADSYLNNRTLEKRPFDLDKMFSMLIDINKYIKLYSPCEMYSNTEKKYKIFNCTSEETFNACAKIWCDFWQVKPQLGVSGNLDYYNINCYIPKQ